MPKNPGLQLYAHFAHRHTAWLTQALREGKAEAFRAYAMPYEDRGIPRIIWIYWRQGEAAAPTAVRHVIASWRRLNPDWDLRVLDEDSAQDWADMRDVPAHLPPRFHANMLRLRLLERYGGVWADATCLCHRPLEDWMPLLGDPTGFFTFGGPHDDRWIDNWFIAAHPENPLIGAWAQAYERYVTRITVKAPEHYFTMIYALQWELVKHHDLRVAFRRAGSLPTVPCYYLEAALEGNAPLTRAHKAIRQGLPVSKLNWRAPVSAADLAATLSGLPSAVNARTESVSRPDLPVSGSTAPVPKCHDLVVPDPGR